jgi:hypothetical protein
MTGPRSRITNARLSGKRISTRALLNSDGRTAWARRYRDLVVMLSDDAGGAESLSELKLGLIRRVAALTIEAERLEVRLAEGEEVDIDLLARTSSHIRRISETIGLNRAMRRRYTHACANHRAASGAEARPRARKTRPDQLSASAKRRSGAGGGRMSALPRAQAGAAPDSPVPFQLEDDGFARAAIVYQRARAEAERRHERCAQWLGSGRRVWRETPDAFAALHERTVARAIARITNGWITEALNGWQPCGGGH